VACLTSAATLHPLKGLVEGLRFTINPGAIRFRRVERKRLPFPHHPQVNSCGHVGRLTPDQIALVPDTQIYDYKCRLRCSRCGRLGASDEVEVRNFIENAPFTTPIRTYARGTPPQMRL
jgi:hypothetical protein